MIRVTNLNKIIDNKTILNNLNLEFKDKSIIGLFGLNGSGKTTLLRILSKVYSKTTGDILFDDKDIESSKDEVFAIFENLYSSNDDTVISLANKYSCFYKKFNFNDYKVYLSMFNFDEKDKIMNYSKGMKKKLAIILALASKSKYIFLDETFDGVDTVSKNMFRKLFLSYIENNDSMIIISSHSVNDLENMVDELILMNEGKILLDSSYNQIVDKYVKVQLAFDDNKKLSLVNDLNPINIDYNGKFINLIFESEKYDIEKIKKLEPLFINEESLKLEEVFELLYKEVK